MATLIPAFLAVLALTMACIVSAQQIPACATGLIPCAGYLNATVPPAACCTPIKDAIKTQMPCLCGLFNNTALMQSFGVTPADAQRLPKACGVKETVKELCAKAAATPTTPSNGTTPSTGSPPATTPPTGSSPATPASPKPSSAHGAAWIGFPGFIGLFLILWSIAA